MDDLKPPVAPGTAAAHPAPTRYRWVPIRSLAPRHRPRIVSHLLDLAPEDRYLRFGNPVSDEQIVAYVDRIDFERDEVFGIFNRRLELLAMAHLAHMPAAGPEPAAAEFGVSVATRARGRGFGGRLFEHAVLHARNRGVDTMIIHALTENTAMLRIVRSAGATVVRDGGDAEARLKLPPEDFVSHVEQALGSHAAELDYRLKAGARRVDDLIGLIAEVRSGIAGSGSNASQ